MKVGLLARRFDPSSRVYGLVLPYQLAQLCDVHLYVNVRGFRGFGPNLPSEKLTIHKFRTPPGWTFFNTLLDSAVGYKILNSGRRSEGLDVTHSLQVGEAMRADMATVNNIPPATLSESIRHRRPLWLPTLFEKAFYSTLDWPFLSARFSRYIASRGCRKLIAPSSITKEELVRLCNIPPENIVVIPYGIDMRRFSLGGEVRSRIRGSLKIREDEVLIAFVSVKMAFLRKGLDLVINALSQTKQTKLLVIGASDLPTFFRDIAAKLGLLSRIICLQTSAIEPYLRAADIFVLPSLHDSFALVVLEAMASGLPVVLSSHVGATDLLTHGYNAVVLKCPESIKQLSDELNKLIGDAALRRQMGRRALEKAREMTWEKVTKSHLAIYEELTRR